MHFKRERGEDVSLIRGYPLPGDSSSIPTLGIVKSYQELLLKPSHTGRDVPVL